MAAELATAVAEVLLAAGDKEWQGLESGLKSRFGDSFVSLVRTARMVHKRGGAQDVKRPIVDALERRRDSRPELATELQAILKEFGQEPAPTVANAISGGIIAGPVIQAGSIGTLHMQSGNPAPPAANDHFDFRGSVFNGPFTGVHQGGGEQPAAGHSGPGDWPLARDVEPIALGVRSTRRVKGLPPLPPYVARDQDDELSAALRQARSEGGLVVVLGEPFAGKTRTALVSMAEVLPDFRVHAPARHENLRGLPALLRGAQERCVVWLDDLDGHLGAEGLEPRLLDRLAKQGVVVLATLREDAYDTYRHQSRGRVLELAHLVELPREWSAGERGRAESTDDPRLLEAARSSGAEGVAAYLAVGPMLWEEWQRARRADRHPRGHLLVRAAIDLARCGLRGPLPRESLVGAYRTYEALPGAERESVDDALAWAAEERHPVLWMLRRSGPTAWEVSPCLVEAAAQDEGFAPVGLAVWRLALEVARTDSSFDLDTVSSGARVALGAAAESGDSQAMHDLGVLEESLGNGPDAESCFRRAADAGHTEAARRLGQRLVERGEAREAEPFLEKAAEGGDAEAATLLGKLLRDRAERWLAVGAHAGNPEAAHLLGDLLIVTGDISRMWDAYHEAAGKGRAEVARSMGMAHLLWNEFETAEVFLRRAADGGDEHAADVLGRVVRAPRSLADAAGYFEPSPVYPLDTVHYGAVLEKQGLLDEARAHYEKGYDMGDAYGAYRLASLLEKEGKPVEAQKWYREAADMGHPAAKKALGETPDPPATVNE